MKNIYGYVRVSTKEQNEDRQLLALQEVGLPGDRIYTDKQSGKDFQRPMYRKLMKKLRAGDLLYVKSIDRLGRNYEEILEQWRYLTKEKRVNICILDMPLLDTRRSTDLIGVFIGDVVLQVLSFVAENERTNIRERQREGIEAAKMRGVCFGRPKMQLPEAFPAVYDAWKRKELSGVEAARRCGMSKSTFYNRAKGAKEAAEEGVGTDWCEEKYSGKV